MEDTQMNGTQLNGAEDTEKTMLSRRNLDNIEDLDKLRQETHQRMKKEQREKKLEEKFKICGKLPSDWTLKTQMDIQINVSKAQSEGEVSEPVVELKKLSKMLSYFLFTPNE